MTEPKIASNEELRHQWGYYGKPKQWQQGFDACLKEFKELLFLIEAKEAIKNCKESHE